MIRHVHVSSCDSTQDLLKEQMSGFPGERLLVSCDNQLKGRGRSDHTWESLPGSLTFSLTIDPHPVMSFTALEISLLVARFFEGSRLGLKWPNDIWNKNKDKCCGVLVQTHQNVMLAGIGVNLFSDHPSYGGVYDSGFEFDKSAWSLELATFILANRYHNSQDLKKDWEERCEHLHQEVRLTEGDVMVEGIFEGLGQYGEAILATCEGRKHFFNGSLRLINPAR